MEKVDLGPDFNRFQPLFGKGKAELRTGLRQTLKYQDKAEVDAGDLFILDGQKLLVADMGEPFLSDYGRPNRRLRVVYDNGTESDLLVRSLQRALNKDKASRRIVTPDLGPLFSGEAGEGDLSTGHISVFLLNTINAAARLSRGQSVECSVVAITSYKPIHHHLMLRIETLN